MLRSIRPTWTVRLAGALAMLALVGTTAVASAQSPAPSAGSPAPAALFVDGAWARTSPMMDMAGAAYLVIHNNGAADDALIGVTSPAANVVETHETKDDGTGQMAMMPVESIPVPAGGSVELKPGSYHIMLIELVAPLEAGAVVPLTLTFQSGTVVDVEAIVGDGPPGAMPMGSDAPMQMGSPAPSMMPM